MAIIETFHLGSADSGEPTSTLSELIAEEHRIWDAHTPLLSEADTLWFAYRDANPSATGLVREGRQELLPEPMGSLYRRARALEKAAGEIKDRVLAWVPRDLGEAILLLEFDGFDGVEEDLRANVVSGLRVIAHSGDPMAQPVLDDRRILGLFREWRAAWDQLDAIADCDSDGPAAVAALARLRVIEKAIADTPAEGVIGLAVKFCLGLWKDGHLFGQITRSSLRDAARFVPELAPLCAEILEEEEESQP
jgi:hypothetical protein